MIEIRLKSADAPDGTLEYVAAQGGRRLGACVFTAGETGEILSVSTLPGEEGLADGLIRSALSLMDRRGSLTAVCRGGADEKILRAVGFSRKDGVWVMEPAKLGHPCGGSGPDRAE
jgi:hypothetical protein